MAWFAVLASIGNFLFVRVSTQFSLRRTIVAVFAMTGISWLFVAAFPFPLYASMVIFQLCGHQFPAIGWLIVPVLLSSLMAAFVGVTVLVGFHEKRNSLRILVAICGESHMYRDFVLSHDYLCVTCPHSGMTNQSWRTGRLLRTTSLLVIRRIGHGFAHGKGGCRRLMAFGPAMNLGNGREPHFPLNWFIIASGYPGFGEGGSSDGVSSRQISLVC